MDFSSLADDQLLQLLKGAMAEAISRGGAMKAAAEGEVLSAQEKARIEFQVAEKIRLEKEELERQRIARQAEARLREEELKKQAEKTENFWARKAAAVKAIRIWGYKESFELNIWSRGADRRVYFEHHSGDRRRGVNWKFYLYLTGNNNHAPGKFVAEGDDSWFDDKQKQLKDFMREFAETWKGDVKIASGSIGTVEPDPVYLKRYLSAIGIDEEGDNAESN